MSLDAAPVDTDRIAYTVNEFCTKVFPLSRAAFYEDVKAGLIRLTKRGHRSYVTIEEARAYPARLAARNAASGQGEAA
jgi:hypothetical protein